MATKATQTPHKEIHSEQEKRIEAERRIQNAKHGQLPDNKELTSGIDKVQGTISKDNDKLSATGRAVTADINNILDTTKEILQQKNEGELLQKAYYHSHQTGDNASYSARIAELKQMARGDSSATREEAKKNVSSMGTIVKLAILSPEFRETINDIAEISNQLLKRQSDKREGKTTSDTPVETHQVHETTIPEHHVRSDGNVEATVVESRPVTETVSAKPTLTKEQKREQREDKLVDRLVDLAQTLHKNPEYRNSIEYMANSASKLKKYSKEKSDTMKEQKRQDKSKENTEAVKHHKHEARMNGKAFLENWIGDDYSLDRLIRQINFLHEKSKTDPELRSLLVDWKKWSTATVKDSSYVEDRERVRRDVKDLITRTRVMNSRYNEEVTIIRREVVYINKSIQRDDSLIKLREDFSQLGRDILKDSNGNATVKPELLQDAQIILASVIESIKYIPLPPIKKSDENMDLELENIVLNATDVTPSNVRFIVQADADRDEKSNTRQIGNSFLIEIKKIRAHLTSVNFYVDKKTGFPKITDRGLADIDLDGQGLGLTIEIVPKVEKHGNDVHSVFEAKTVTCTIDKLKIHLRETSHDTLYKLLSPIINMVAKKKIESGIASYVQENMNKMNRASAQRASNAATKKDRKMQEKKQHS